MICISENYGLRTTVYWVWTSLPEFNHLKVDSMWMELSLAGYVSFLHLQTLWSSPWVWHCDPIALPKTRHPWLDLVMWYDPCDPHFQKITRIIPHDPIQLLILSVQRGQSDHSGSSGQASQNKPMDPNNELGETITGMTSVPPSGSLSGIILINVLKLLRIIPDSTEWNLNECNAY